MGMENLYNILMDVVRSAQAGDAQAIMIAGLSAALFVILMLMILIALMGRKDTKAEKETQANDRPTAQRVAPNVNEAIDNEAVAEEHSAFDELSESEDFLIFKRGERKSEPRKQTALPTTENLSIEENLQLIEREMVKLRDLFKQGHVSRDVYVDETRNLYHQAKAIAALK